MKYTYVTHLHCPKCDKTFETGQQHHLCECGSPLLVDYDLEALKEWSKDSLKDRKPDLWRYHELLPVDEEHIVSLGEGMTPMIEMSKYGESIGIKNLLCKDEGLLPSGSFKSRGAAVGVSMAKQLGVKELAMPTNGNAGASWSLYCARAGIKSTVIMPVDAPMITRKECVAAGGNLLLVNGLITDAGKIVGEAVKEHDIYDSSTLKEPYRIEGKKTMGLEIMEQLDFKAPDVILYPTGGGVGIIGIHKAIRELQALGWAGEKMPRLVAVQAEGCAPIVKAWENNQKESEFWPDSTTQAFGINVPKAIGDFLVLNAIYDSNGCAIAISDEELLEEEKKVASLEGNFVCPEGAACFVAARKLAEQGWIKPDEQVVVLNTGAGIKYPETVQVDVPTLNIGDKLPR